MLPGINAQEKLRDKNAGFDLNVCHANGSLQPLGPAAHLFYLYIWYYAQGMNSYIKCKSGTSSRY